MATKVAKGKMVMQLILGNTKLPTTDELKAQTICRFSYCGPNTGDPKISIRNYSPLPGKPLFNEGQSYYFISKCFALLLFSGNKLFKFCILILTIQISDIYFLTAKITKYLVLFRFHPNPRAYCFVLFLLLIDQYYQLSFVFLFGFGLYHRMQTDYIRELLLAAVEMLSCKLFIIGSIRLISENTGNHSLLALT